MKKSVISNFQLPHEKDKASKSCQILSELALSKLRYIASEKVMKVTLRAIVRAELYDGRHPFWNALASCYTRMAQRLERLNDTFTGISKVIHNSEIKTGDILVSDFNTGLNFGYMGGGLESVKVRVLETGREITKGMVVNTCNSEDIEIGYFRNELWFFISHKFMIPRSDRISIH